MVTSNTTKKIVSERGALQHIRAQLDEAQKIAGQTEQLLAEARSILLSYTRNITSIRYTNFSEMVLEASKSAEVLTEQMRRMSLEVTLDVQTYENYNLDLVRIHGIGLNYEDDILIITLPVLAPHRKERYTDYLYKPLYTACRHWCLKRNEEKQSIPDFEKCTICFIHQYDENLPLCRIRDHDNYEEKHVLDVLANFFMTATDSGIYVDTYHMTRMSDKDGTLIFIMDTNRFCGWLGSLEL